MKELIIYLPIYKNLSLCESILKNTVLFYKIEKLITFKSLIGTIRNTYTNFNKNYYIIITKLYYYNNKITNIEFTGYIDLCDNINPYKRENLNINSIKKIFKNPSV